MHKTNVTANRLVAGDCVEHMGDWLRIYHAWTGENGDRHVRLAPLDPGGHRAHLSWGEWSIITIRENGE